MMCQFLTFNQRVSGSNPDGPTTNKIKHLKRKHPQRKKAPRVLLRVLLQVYPAFAPSVLDSSQDFTASSGYRTRPPIFV